MNWRQQAACRDQNLNIFFPVGTTGQTEQAKAVCARCPVAEACLEWALNTNQDAGIWGGTTEDERRTLRRNRQRKRKTQ